MKRPTITLCLIAKNEAHNIQRLQDSIEGCFDEVHMVDTGSTDDTKRVAESVGWQVYDFEWIQDFSAARNESIKRVMTDYWMWMDLDDVLENKEGFKLWRDTAMGLGDIFVAPYKYVYDKQGNVLCQFIRERVFKTRLGFKWSDFIHEGVKPEDSEGITRKMNPALNWCISHQRTDTELEQDRGRNLAMLEAKEKELSPRLRFYYGKELYDARRYLDAIYQLKEVLKEEKMELHDRKLAIQYLVYSLLEKEEFAEVIKFAHIGINLDPNRAEYYCAIGDAYLRQRKIIEARPFYYAAMNCTNVGANGFDATYTVATSYDIHPRINAANIAMNLCQFSEVIRLLDGRVKGNEVGEKILSDAVKAIRTEARPKNPQEKNEIVISCNPHTPYQWDEHVYKEKGIGGSETAAVEMSMWLKKLTGLPVKIFNRREKEWIAPSGVEYLPETQVQSYFHAVKPRLHIAWRHNVKVTDAPTYLWCHDLITGGGQVHENYDGILALSNFHKRFLQTQHMIPEEKILISRNGLNLDRFHGIDKTNKVKGKVIWSSSPDRGLERAIAVMEMVREKIPEATLHVFYGLENMIESPDAEMRDKAKMLKGMMDAREWIQYHGNVEQTILAKEFCESVVWLYPANFIETFCITAIESLVARCWPVARSIGALEDTLREASETGQCDLIDSDCDYVDEVRLYADKVIDAIENEKWQNITCDPEKFTWESVAREWIELFNLNNEASND